MARLLASQAQANACYRTARPLRNLYLDAAASSTRSHRFGRDQIQRLNSVGENIYGEVGTRTGGRPAMGKLTGNEVSPSAERGQVELHERPQYVVPFTISAMFVDVAVDELGHRSVIDGQRNQATSMTSGQPAGNFSAGGYERGKFCPTGQHCAGPEGRLYVLDARRGNIQISARRR